MKDRQICRRQRFHEFDEYLIHLLVAVGVSYPNSRKRKWAGDITDPLQDAIVEMANILWRGYAEN